MRLPLDTAGPRHRLSRLHGADARLVHASGHSECEYCRCRRDGLVWGLLGGLGQCGHACVLGRGGDLWGDGGGGVVGDCGGGGDGDWEGDGGLREIGLVLPRGVWGLMGVVVSRKDAWVCLALMGLKGLGILVWSHR